MQCVSREGNSGMCFSSVCLGKAKGSQRGQCQTLAQQDPWISVDAAGSVCRIWILNLKGVCSLWAKGRLYLMSAGFFFFFRFGNSVGMYTTVHSERPRCKQRLEWKEQLFEALSSHPCLHTSVCVGASSLVLMYPILFPHPFVFLLWHHHYLCLPPPLSLSHSLSLCMCVCVSVAAAVPVVLDFLTDLANLWSVEGVGNVIASLTDPAGSWSVPLRVWALLRARPVLPHFIVLQVAAPLRTQAQKNCKGTA